ncbi:MAG: hypothetical protein J5I93_16875 [Pirellulaceae bacterium]|nr:hypothetical protein [Pirellulaceae bacterium]
MKRLVTLAAVLLGSLAASAQAREIGFVEDFALAEDRARSLEQLIPGTEDYYYYYSLHYQNTEQFEKVGELLTAWIQRYNYTPRVKEIQNRQALLTYARQPQATLEHIRQQLGLQFNHQRVAIGQKPNLPTALDLGRLTRQRLTADALARHKNLNGFEDSALDWLVATELNAERRRHLVERLQRPDYDNLPKLVVDDLNTQFSRGFGSAAIHGQLLPPQLEECLKLKPELLNEANFVNTYLSKLRPSDDADWRNDPQQQLDYLERLWAFVSRLGPVHNSLKAHVLYRRLAFDRSQGLHDKPRFMAYIQLPRNVGYINPQFMQKEENRRFPADLNQDFNAQTQFPAVGNDEPLVRAYLHHFFLTETTYDPYLPYINDTFLKHNFAEAKIVNGLGDAERWFSLLPPAQYQALKDRVDLDFAPTNRPIFGADDPVSLDVYVKNVRSLIIKVYEVNAQNYYRQELREVNTDINLDGLVANQEQTVTLEDPPLRRVRRHYDFPALNKPGVYVIDFIGNGQSSRAVIRKGKLRHLVRTTTAGQEFTVLDDANRKLPDARLWLAGREYTADQDGTILVPYSNEPGRQPVVLSHGGFSSLGWFQHEPESYQLRAGIYVDRESLLQRAKAQVVVRPSLLLNGTPITLSVLEDVRLTLTSVDLDGVSTTKEVDKFELFENRDSFYEFQVPPRLAQITFQLRAKVKNLSQAQQQDLGVAETFSLNEIDRTDKIDDLHLAWIDGQYVVEVLGKTGEVRRDRPVNFSFKHRDFTEAVNVSLQSDQAGRILLGPLADVALVTATTAEGVSHAWPLGRNEDRCVYPQTLHGVAGEAVQLPFMRNQPQPERAELSLLELRGNTFVADRFEAMAIQNGLLELGGLPPGDYDLLLKRGGQRIRVRLTAGERREGYVLGAYRQLEDRGGAPLQIVSLGSQEDQVVVQLRNAGQFARVHVLATRFQPEYSVFELLSRVGDAEPRLQWSPRFESLFVEGRNIGDEFRYIIDRRYATRFPGNMLTRPGLLLNPWAIRKTESTRQEALEGDAYFAQPQSPPAEAAAGADRGGGGAAQAGNFSNLDFLAGTSAVLLNLIPDENGRVTVDKAALGDHQHLHVVAVDPRSTVYRTVSVAEQATEFQDLRLLVGLDPQQHFTQQKQISVVGGGQPLTLRDITTSRFEVYDSLARVYGLYMTLSGDAHLAEFGFLLNWPQMDAAEKQTLYSKYACHELNFFLYKRDPEFFQQVVAPYLANKLHKTFLDRCLLGEDLQEYLRPWNHQQLNTVERILLAQRVAGETDYTSRQVRHLFDMIPPDLDRFNLLFNTALQGRALDTSDQFGLQDARNAALAESLLEQRKLSMEAGRPLAELKRDAKGKAESAERLQAMTREADALAAAPPKPGMAGARARQAGEKELEMANGARDKAYFKKDAERRSNVEQLYRKLDKTEEWVENNYYKLPIDQQNADLVQVNAFWLDYAQHDPRQPFFSVNLAESSRNFTEMMFALALLDLPFQAGEHKSEFEKQRMTLTAGSPLVVFHEEIKPADDVAEQTPILVSQNFFRHNDRYRFVNNERVDKYVTDEFLVHTVYGCQIVVTNPTSARQKLDLLLQIPVGALPVLNGRATNSVHVDLQPFNTQTLEYHFYFPQDGEFPHYPVHVSKNEQLLAHAAPVVLKVVEELSRIDRESWEYVSQNGTGEDVINYLKVNNPYRIDLAMIAFRMQDAEYFASLTELLARQHVYSDVLWSYGIKHNAVPQIREYLRHQDAFVQQCGSWLDSPLLTIDPVERKAYEQMEYSPLVNARAHQLGRRRQILNDRLFEQYHRLLAILSCRRALDDEELMSVTYYLLLQDRIEEAMHFFARVNPDQLATRMQYDYFTAYLDFFNAQPEVAAGIVARYEQHPVDRWRNAFANVRGQLDEIQGKGLELVDPDDRTQRQTQLAASQPAFDFEVEAGAVRISYKNLDQVRVNYYLMDIELLFSRNPFVQQFAGQFSFIRPNATQEVKLPAEGESLTFPLPEELHNKNVLVEIQGGGLIRNRAYYSNSMAVQLVENYGQLQVTSSNPGRPLAKVYVKAYAQMQDGSVQFYRDGYTDLRGRFDYSSLNTNELEFVQKFSLLILSDEHGAVVREAQPPKR